MEVDSKRMEWTAGAGRRYCRGVLEMTGLVLVGREFLCKRAVEIWREVLETVRQAPVESPTLLNTLRCFMTGQLEVRKPCCLVCNEVKVLPFKSANAASNGPREPTPDLQHLKRPRNRRALRNFPVNGSAYILH